MAEFCIACWNRISKTNAEEKMYILSRDLDLYEGCGQWKPVIIRQRMRYVIKDIVEDLLKHKHIR